MFKPMRGAVIGIIALMSIALTAAPALGTLTVQPVSPSGAYSFVPMSDKITGLLSYPGLLIACHVSTLAMTLTSSGTGTAPAGSLGQQDCTNSFGVHIYTQTSAWTIRAVTEAQPPPSTSVLVGFDVNVPSRGWEITTPIACTYTVSGSFTVGKIYPGATRYAVTTRDLFATLALPKQTMTVDSFTGAGCSIYRLTLRLAWAVQWSLVLNRATTIG